MYFLAVDKPAGYTSHDIVGLFRVLTGIKKIGHTGTLDPFATGVLVLAFEDATKLIGYIPLSEKRYQCVLQLGTQTETADCTGEVVECKAIPENAQEGIERVLPQFQGRIRQQPPIYSAIKVNGRRLYDYARKGESVEIPVREVDIFSLEMLRDWQGLPIADAQVALDVTCSKGTYIRSLGCDIAEAIGTLGHLAELRRLSSDGVTLQKALHLFELAQLVVGNPAEVNEENWRMVLSKEGRTTHRRHSRDEIIRRLAPFCLTVEQVFERAPIIHATDAESIRLAQGLCLPSLLQKVQGLEEVVYDSNGNRIVQVHWNNQQLALLNGDGGILRVNPSIACMRTTG